MKKLRKFLTVSVMVLSIIAMSGLTVNTASAAAQAGDLIKMDGLSSVYYLGNDGKRYVFPSESVYFSWYQDFSSVVTIPASELQSYPLGSNVTMRPGTKLVKITTDPSVYAVTPNGVLRKIASESDAITLYGTNWAKMVVDVADAFFTNYTVGTPLTSGEYPAGTLLKNANNASVYYFDGTNYRMIASEAAFNANRFSFNNVITTGTTLSASGNSITAKEDLSSPTGGVGTVVTGSGLTVALSAATPASMNIPTGSPANFFALNLTAANDGAVNVSSLKLTAYELGTATNIDDVTIFDNGVKVGTSKNINSDKEAVFAFANPIYVAAGTTKTLTVKATTAAAGDYALGIAKAADITATAATVSGSFPVRGNKMSAVVSSNVGTLAMSSVDTTDSTVDFGEDDVLLASFNLTANNEDALLTSMKFKNGSTNVDGIISNLKMLIDGTEVASGTYADSYATFSLNNFKVEKGDSVTVEVRGDMGTTNVGDKVTLYLKDRADIAAVGATYGYDLQLDTTSFQRLDTVTEGMTLTLAASDFTLDADKAATPAKDIKAGDNDVVLATIKMKSNGENATLEEITGAGNFTIIGTALLVDEVKNVRMIDVTSGATYDLDATFDTDHYELTLSDEISFTKGVTKTFVVKADIDDLADANDTLKVHLEADGMKVTGDVSNASITDITPSQIEGSIMTVKDASLAWNVTNLTAKTVVTGASNVEVYQAKLKAGAADGVKLNSLKLSTTANNATNFSDNNITKLDLYINGQLVKSVSNNIVEATAGTKGTITFNSLSSNTINANQEVDLVVKATFSSSFSGSNTFALEVAAEADINAKSVTGNKVVDITGGITGGARTITLATMGTLKVELLTSDTNASQDQYVLAGATSASKYLGELKFTTANEPVKVKTLTLTSLGTDTSSDIKEVRLVKADGTVVASKTVESNGSVVFDPLDLTFDADKSTSLFVSTLARGINVDGDATATATQGHTIQYNLGAGAAITAEGVNSGEAITMIANNDGTLSAGEWDDDSSTKTHTITAVKLNSVVNAMSNTTLSSGRQDIAKYTLTFEHGNNRDANNDAYKAQLDHFALTINQSGATTTNLTMKVEGTTRDVADSATAGTWTSTELQNATTGLLNLAKVDDVVTLVISADIAIDTNANNYSVQTVISDLNGAGGNDSIRHNSLTNMYLPYTSVTGANLTN